MSISLVTAIAVDRYVAVRHPLRARELRSPRQAAAVCVALWVIVVTSLVVRWRLGMQEGGFCFSSQTRRNFSTTAFSLLGFYLPLAIVVFCSLQVVTVLSRRPAADVGQAEATQKATHMVWANLAVFVICFLPLHVVLTVQVSLNLNTCAARDTFSRALSITGKLSDTNCCLDAICYYYMAREFQEASKPATSSNRCEQGALDQPEPPVGSEHSRRPSWTREAASAPLKGPEDSGSNVRPEGPWNKTTYLPFQI